MNVSLDTILQQAVETRAVPHIIGRIIRDGDVVYEGVYGAASADRIYRIASMTKAVTSVAVMQLYERGRLDLDAPLTTYMEIPAPKVLEGFEANGSPRLRPAARSATVRELLTHTSGYAYGLWNEQLHRFFRTQGLTAMGPAGAERLTAPMVADPGTAWNYSISTDFLGRLVEVIADTDLDTYMQSAIFAPLGMADTGFTLPKGADARLMPVFQRLDNGKLTPLDLPRPDPAGFCSGGGGLISTPADYTRFLQALLNGGAWQGARTLQASTLELMAANHTGDLPIPSMATFDPAMSAACHFFPGTPKHWGLGFLINAEDVAGQRSAGSLTWAGFYNTHFWIDCKRGLAGLLMTQLLPFCDPRFIDLYNAFEHAVYRSV